MKKVLSIFLVLVMCLSLSACGKSEQSNAKYRLAGHKVELKAPGLKNIAKFVFCSGKDEHIFADDDGNIYRINFEKLFSETDTNVKFVQKDDSGENYLREQADVVSWLAYPDSYIDFIKDEGINLNQTVCFENSFLTFNDKKLLVYTPIDLRYRYYYNTEKNNEFKLLKEFEDNIVSINGCVIKTESNYYLIEKYVVNAEEAEKYADIEEEFDLRIVEMPTDIFDISLEDITFLYTPSLESDSYFIIDKNNNYYFDKRYVGNIY